MHIKLIIPRFSTKGSCRVLTYWIIFIFIEVGGFRVLKIRPFKLNHVTFKISKSKALKFDHVCFSCQRILNFIARWIMFNKHILWLLPIYPNLSQTGTCKGSYAEYYLWKKISIKYLTRETPYHTDKC